MNHRGMSLAERLWVNVTRTESCWTWNGTKTSTGYGSIRDGHKMLKVHRVSYALFHGTIPEGMEIDHICHHRDCVNPKHLRLATRKQNCENRICTREVNGKNARGVSWDKSSQRWLAYVKHRGKMISLGHFEEFDDAKDAATAKRLELFTHNDADRYVIA